MPAVQVEELEIRYGDTVAVDSLSLSVSEGETVVLLGRNGAGKTSTVEAIEGYRKATGGRIKVLGLDPTRDRRELIPHLGVMLQGGGFYPSMGPVEALELFASYYENPQDPAELLERVGLVPVAKTPWRRLSGGERQRLSLGLALIGRPSVVLLDEPTAGVDPEGRVAIRELISELTTGGACVLLTTHELEEAEKVAHRVVIIDRGKTLASGTLTELSVSSGEGFVRFSTSPGIDVKTLGARLGANVREDKPGQYVVEAYGRPSTVAALAVWLGEHDFDLHDMRVGTGRLEDLYLSILSNAPPPDPAPHERQRRGRRARRRP